MSQMIDFASLFSSKRVEPEKRLVGGRYGWAIHRFPIKGGVTMWVVIAENITRNNALFQRLKARNGKP